MGHSPAHAQKALSGKDIIWDRLKDLLCTYWNSFTVRLVDQDAAFVPAVADRIEGDVARCRDVIGLIVEDEAIHGGTVISPSTRIMLCQIADLRAQGGEVAELLGRVDGFDQHQPARKTDDGRVADVCFLAAHGNALEALELAHGLFDACTKFIEALRKKAPSLLGVFAARDNWCDAAGTGRRPVGLAVISLVRHRDARADVWAYVEGRLELCAVADLATGQMEV